MYAITKALSDCRVSRKGWSDLHKFAKSKYITSAKAGGKRVAVYNKYLKLLKKHLLAATGDHCDLHNADVDLVAKVAMIERLITEYDSVNTKKFVRNSDGGAGDTGADAAKPEGSKKKTKKAEKVYVWVGRIPGGYREDSRGIPGGYWEDTGRIAGGYWQDTGRILGGYWEVL